ncbi:MAG TPA: hypothetical protein VHB21_19055 [Minicystis sp.]|nr:hypothetical protein [Minicystis sp.]
MRALRSAAVSIAIVALFGCEDPPQFLPTNVPGGPAGALDGTVTYAGPLPCTEGGHVVGAAVLLVFDVNLLPPPEGLGTSAASLATVAGEKLFAGVRDRLTFTADGSRWCPDAKAAHVTVSATWTDSPLAGGTYEVRGFYDLDGDFDPAFSISNEPTKGDVGGGAIENAADVLQGAPPVYRRISLGTLQSDGTRVIPDTGAHVGGVAVTLGLPLADERPVFHVASVLDPAKQSSASKVQMASDFQLATFTVTDPTGTEGSFLRVDFGAGVATSEVGAATKSPFFLPGNDATLDYARQDVNGDGTIDTNDHVPESTLLPALYPVAIFSKLAEGEALVAQTGPSVIVEGITLYKSLLQTVTVPTDFTSAEPDALVAVRPAALCIDTTDPSAHAVLVVTHETDASKPPNPVLPDEAGVKAALSAQFHRAVDLVYGCLPEGTYAMNLVYGTGQTWTVPNEAGVCAPSEKPNASGTTCGTRPRLASQAATFVIGPPKDASYCAKHPTPAACKP